MDFVLLMPGQGSQKPGMAKDVCSAFPEARHVFQTVDDAVQASISSIAFEGPADLLTQTINAQPALLAHSAAVWAVVKREIGEFVRGAAGHSLGEFSAYHAVGSLSVSDSALVVRTRGRLMFEQGNARPGTMAAIIGDPTTPIEAICEQASRETALVVPANFNSPGQVVISGEPAGIERAMQLAKEAGAKRCLPLPVSGAFHSPLMAPAAAGLADVLESVAIDDPSVPVVANVNGEPVTGAAQAKKLLIEQLTAPVQWVRVMLRLAEMFPEATYVEMGPGNVLAGLARRIAPELRVMTCGTAAEIDSLIKLVHSTSSTTDRNDEV